jgi:hypothetical protein
MAAIRYAALIALVFWLGSMVAQFMPHSDRISYICAAIILACLVLMKLVGPPPHSVFPRIGLVLLMLAIAIYSGVSASREASAALTGVNIVLGCVLLFWYIRE